RADLARLPPDRLPLVGVREDGVHDVPDAGEQLLPPRVDPRRAPAEERIVERCLRVLELHEPPEPDRPAHRVRRQKAESLAPAGAPPLRVGPELEAAPVPEPQATRAAAAGGDGGAGGPQPPGPRGGTRPAGPPPASPGRRRRRRLAVNRSSSPVRTTQRTPGRSAV